MLSKPEEASCINEKYVKNFCAFFLSRVNLDNQNLSATHEIKKNAK
jgi:hypothetical protein